MIPAVFAASDPRCGPGVLKSLMPSSERRLVLDLEEETSALQRHLNRLSEIEGQLLGDLNPSQRMQLESELQRVQYSYGEIKNLHGAHLDQLREELVRKTNLLARETLHYLKSDERADDAAVLEVARSVLELQRVRYRMVDLPGPNGGTIATLEILESELAAPSWNRKVRNRVGKPVRIFFSPRRLHEASALSMVTDDASIYWVDAETLAGARHSTVGVHEMGHLYDARSALKGKPRMRDAFLMHQPGKSYTRSESRTYAVEATASYLRLRSQYLEYRDRGLSLQAPQFQKWFIRWEDFLTRFDNGVHFSRESAKILADLKEHPAQWEPELKFLSDYPGLFELILKTPDGHVHRFRTRERSLDRAVAVVSQNLSGESKWDLEIQKAYEDVLRALTEDSPLKGFDEFDRKFDVSRDPMRKLWKLARQTGPIL